jgi:hypothetical protein
MKKILTEKQQKELVFMKDFILFVSDYIHKDLEEPDKSIYEEAKIYLIDGLKKGVEIGEIRGMRMAFNDTLDMAKDLSYAQKEELNAILREKFGTDLNEQNNKNYKKIKRVLQRGKIKTDEEFYLLKERIDEIYEDESKSEEVDELGTLLLNYENSKRV